MQILRQLIREQLDPRHDRSGAAIAFFSPFPGYIVFIAYDIGSLNSALFGDIDSPTVSPTVYSTLYLYSTPSENCNGAFEISSAESKVQRRGWGTDVRLAALGTLSSIMPDRHSVTDASSAVWQSLIDKGMIVGKPLPIVCLGDEFEGVRGHAEEKLNMSYKLAKPLPAHVIDMLARGKAHRKQIDKSDLLGLAQDLLIGRS